ncbi:hypothetical protein ACH79_43335 [Bradyrhizobium sp. CCBAU 051011]|nr:hypothetical protein ACH79_43335 [Bradyrhizobium sp. CCBAU 051011]
MVSAGCFFKAFGGFFGFGRMVVRLCAFMCAPSSCLRTQANGMPVKFGDATGLRLTFVGAFLWEFDNGCVTHLGDVAKKTAGQT